MVFKLGCKPISNSIKSRFDNFRTGPYMIPADAPPSFDGHREGTFATVHAVAPFYSVLVRVNPENPASTTDFVCDVCTEIPEPADGGRTYAFPIREDVRFQDGSAPDRQ